MAAAQHPVVPPTHAFEDLKLCVTLINKELMARYDFTQKDMSRFLRFVQVLCTGNGNVSKALFDDLLGVAVRHQFLVKRGDIEPLADEKEVGTKGGLFKIPPSCYSWTKDKSAEENTCLGLRKSASLKSLLEVRRHRDKSTAHTQTHTHTGPERA